MFRLLRVGISMTLFALAVASSTEAQTFNLATDWSDTVNPNGTWSYGLLSSSGNFTPFAIHTNTYINVGPPAFSGNQPAWTDSANTGNNGTPEGLAKSIGISNMDFPSGRVGGHTAPGNYLAVRWTAPVAGTIDITGGVWMWRDIGRVEGVSLFVNGNALFNDVAIPSRGTGITSSNTFTLADAITASGGSASNLSNLSVTQGETVILAARKLSVSEDFVGMDFQVRLAPVPAPSALAVFVIGVVPGVAVVLRRRHKA